MKTYFHVTIRSKLGFCRLLSQFFDGQETKDIDTLQQAQKALIDEINEMVPHYPISSFSISEKCKYCSGTGTVYKKTGRRRFNLYKEIRCPSCRGKNSSVIHLQATC